MELCFKEGTIKRLCLSCLSMMVSDLLYELNCSFVFYLKLWQYCYIDIHANKPNLNLNLTEHCGR